MRGRKTKRMLTVAAVLLLAALMLPVSAFAATKRYVKLYRKELKKGKGTYTSGNYTYEMDYKSFVILDINKDGTPELIIKSDDPKKAFARIAVYTVKKKKLYYCGSYGTKTSSKKLYYNKKYKGVYDSWWTNGVGGSGVVLYGVSTKKHELPVRFCAWEGAESMGSSKMIYQIGKSYKTVSEQRYKKYINKYFNLKKNYKTKTFKVNNAKNRRKIK